MEAAQQVQPSAAVCAWCGVPIAAATSLDYAIVRCAACGAGTTLPRPTPDELAAAYGEWYRPSAGRFLLGLDTFFRHSRGRLARRLDRIAPPGPVLDVGAGAGVLLDALHAVGRNAVGLEPESQRSDVRALAVHEVEGEWAAVVFWHSLEHLPESGEALEAAVGLLAPGGVVVIALPNLGSLQARLFGERWLALDVPRHLVHVPAEALIRRLRALGLDVTRVSHWRGGQIAFGWLHGLVAALPGHPDLYDALRRDSARHVRQGPGRRVIALVLASLLAPLALMCAAIEIAVRRAGTVYVEARRG